MAEIRLEDVTKVFGDDVVAVDDVSLTVGDGELVVFVGPSGSGKSTTLRMIAGLEELTDGEIHIGDERVNDVQPQDRDVAMVFQSFALYPHRTVRQNISFPLEARGMSSEDIEDRVAESAAILGIEELLDRKPAELSGGQQQRVALGRAIVRDPRAFLLDEPLANLDAKLRKGMRAELVQIQQDLGATMVHVTHNQEEAMTMGDRVAIMHRGELQQLDPPATVYNEPANRFVAGFIGSPSMNFLEGSVSDGSFESADGDVAVALPESLASVDLDGQVTLGVRPENVVLVDGPGEYTVEGTVVVSELLGDATVVHAEVADGEFLAKVDPGVDVEPGEWISFRLAPEELHLFDGVDEMAERVTAAEATVSQS